VVDEKDGMHLAGYVVAYAILLGCAVVCALKGKFWFVAFGVLLPIFWIIGSVRPSRSGAFWASHFQDDSQGSGRHTSN